MAEYFFDNNKLFKLLFNWKLPILTVLILSVVAGVFVSSPKVIIPLYKSNSIIYPVNLGHYSEETPTEQMIQVLKSNYIQDIIIDEFDFYSKYNINKKNARAAEIAEGRYLKRVNIEPTKYESVEITVLDPDANDAFLICQRIIDSYNEKVSSMYREKVKEVLDIQERTLEQFTLEIEGYEGRLKELRLQYGILDYVQQTERLTEGYVKALTSSGVSNKSIGIIENKIKNLQEKGGEYMAIQSLLFSAREFYNATYIEYHRSKKEYEKVITYAQVITSPQVSAYKSYPKRSIIVLGFILTNLFLSVLIIAFIEKGRKNGR